MMQHSTDYNSTYGALGMGDRFQTTQHGPVVTVAWTEGSADGSIVYLRESDGSLTTPPTYGCVHVVERAPRCGCGRRYENCEYGCEWPEALEALFMV